MLAARAAAVCTSALVAAAAVGAAAAPASAQAGAPSIDAASCEPSDVAAQPTARCSVSGSGFPANKNVRVSIRGAFADAPADAQGSFATTELFTTSDACGRTEEVTAFAEGGPGERVRASAQVQVVCTAVGGPAAPAQELPLTGPRDVLPLVLAGLGVAAAGGVMLIAGRPRETSAR